MSYRAIGVALQCRQTDTVCMRNLGLWLVSFVEYEVRDGSFVQVAVFVGDDDPRRVICVSWPASRIDGFRDAAVGASDQLASYRR